jgi:Arc/MetJ-type ribon-helix-helix transcriptional regulator
MPGTSSNSRVQRLRETRRERGERETNVWLSRRVGEAIEEVVREGHFRTRQEAIHQALEAAFVHREMKIVK